MQLTDKCRECFEVLAVPARFKIFTHLKENNSPLIVSKLVELTRLRQPTVTFHLDKLEKAGLIKKEKTGKLVFCHINRKCNDCLLFN